MPKEIIRLKMLVSSTSELRAERGLVDQVISDINRVLEDTFGVTIRVIDWRRDVVPGVGTDPQQVINSQTADYEIYLGMLGTRFGTPTPRAGSGTEDEFNVAYQRFRRDPQSLRLLFYFRTMVSTSAFDIDPEQLRSVLAFRDRVGRENGLLYCDFGAPEEFMQLLRDHLLELVRSDWQGERWKPVAGLAPKTEDVGGLIEAKALPIEEEELGPLDLRVRMDEAFEAAMAAVRGVSGLMAAASVSDRAWTAEVQAATSARAKPKQAQQLINGKAADFGRRARELQALRGAFRAARDEFFEMLTKSAQGQVDRGETSPAEMASALSKITVADSAVRGARDTYVGVASTLSALPELTRDFKVQKRRLREEIERLSADIGEWLDRSAALRSQFGIEPGLAAK